MSNKNAPATNGNESAPDKRDYKQGDDLFPESLLPAVFTSRSIPPVASGQCAQVLSLIRQHQPLLSFVLTADHAIPEAAARVHDLRAMGFNIITRIVPEVVFRGAIRRNTALYSLGTPEWFPSTGGR